MTLNKAVEIAKPAPLDRLNAESTAAWHSLQIRVVTEREERLNAREKRLAAWHSLQTRVLAEREKRVRAWENRLTRIITEREERLSVWENRLSHRERRLDYQEEIQQECEEEQCAREKGLDAQEKELDARKTELDADEEWLEIMMSKRISNLNDRLRDVVQRESLCKDRDVKQKTQAAAHPHRDEVLLVMLIGTWLIALSLLAGLGTYTERVVFFAYLTVGVFGFGLHHYKRRYHASSPRILGALFSALKHMHGHAQD